MKFKLLTTFLFFQFVLFAQNTQPVYFETGKSNLNPAEAQKLISFIKKNDTNQISSFSLYIYQNEIDNTPANLDAIQKRTEALKKLLADNNFEQRVHIVFSRESKPDDVTYSKAKLTEIYNKSKKIDVAVNLNSISSTQINSTKKSTTKQPQINKLAPLSTSLENNKLTVYFEGQETKADPIDVDKLLQALRKIDTTLIKSITFYTYNDDSGNKDKNYAISKQRAENLREEVYKNIPNNLKVYIRYQGDIKTEIKEGYSDNHIEYLRNKNRRIDVVQNLNSKTNINKTTPKKQPAVVTRNIPVEKPFQFSEKSNTYIIYFKGKDNIQPNEDDIKIVVEAIRKMDTLKVKSITLNAYNDKSGNEKYDHTISNQRLDGVKKIILNNTNKDIVTSNKGTTSIPNNDFLSDLHKEYLRNKNRHVDVVTNYDEQNRKDLAELNLSFNFTPNSSFGEQIYLKNLFPDDRSIITKEMALELDKIVLQLKKYSNIHAEIQGHICCTNGGTEAIDKDTGKTELSINRAKAVYNYLVKKGIDPKRLRYKGYGNKKPLGNADVFNKRIVFYVIKNIKN